MQPESLAQMRARLNAEHHTLSRRLKDVSDYMRRHPQSVALETLAVIAERAGVHPSTLVRFANHFGFAGFSDLQRLYKAHVHDNFNDYGERIRHLQGDLDETSDVLPMRLLNEFSEATLLSLQALRQEIDPEALNRAVEMLDAARIIHVAGMRRAFPVSMYFIYALSHMGAPSHAIDGLGLMVEEQARAVGPDDVLIAITFAPYAQATRDVIDAARGNGARVILLTDSLACPRAEVADVLFTVRDAEVRSFRSLNSSLCLAQTLCIALGYRREAR